MITDSRINLFVTLIGDHLPSPSLRYSLSPRIEDEMIHERDAGFADSISHNHYQLARGLLDIERSVTKSIA